MVVERRSCWRSASLALSVYLHDLIAACLCLNITHPSGNHTTNHSTPVSQSPFGLVIMSESARWSAGDSAFAQSNHASLELTEPAG
jgi:hypothetical protein